MIAGAAPAEFILAIRALLNLRYFAQMRRVDTIILDKIAAALRTFHYYKQIILDNRYRVGKKKNPITHFEIPKLELLHSVVRCIQWFGVLPQWSADRTEYSHIDFIKRPKSKTNGHNYSSQICRHLDRLEKTHFFNLATTILEGLPKDANDTSDDDTSNFEPDDTSNFELEDYNMTDEAEDNLLPISDSLNGPKRPIPDFFNAEPLPSCQPSALHRTFSTNNTAFRLNMRPNIMRLLIDDTAAKFNLPNLQVSVRDWFADYLRNLSGL